MRTSILVFCLALTSAQCEGQKTWQLLAWILNSSYAWNDSLSNTTSESFAILSGKFAGPNPISPNKTAHAVSFERSFRVSFTLKDVEKLDSVVNASDPYKDPSRVSIFVGMPKRDGNRIHHVLRLPVLNSLDKTSPKYNDAVEYLKHYIECFYSKLDIAVETLEIEYGNVLMNFLIDEERTAGWNFSLIFRRLKIQNSTSCNYWLNASCFTSTEKPNIDIRFPPFEAICPPGQFYENSHPYNVTWSKTAATKSGSTVTPASNTESTESHERNTTAAGSTVTTPTKAPTAKMTSGLPSTTSPPSGTSETVANGLTSSAGVETPADLRATTSSGSAPTTRQTRTDAHSHAVGDLTTTGESDTWSTINSATSASVTNVLQSLSPGEIGNEKALDDALLALDGTFHETTHHEGQVISEILDFLTEATLNLKNLNTTIHQQSMKIAVELVSSIAGTVDPNDAPNFQGFVSFLEDLGSLIEISNGQKFVSIETKTLSLKLADADPDQDFSIGPSYNNTVLSDIKIPKSAMSWSAGKLRVLSITFRDSTLFQSTESLSAVVSIKVGGGRLSNLDERITIAFETENATGGKRSVPGTLKADKTTLECVFYDEDAKRWSRNGCYLNEKRSPPTCEVDHLTSFSVIVNSQQVTEDVALSVVSTTGCILSILGLFLTIVLYLYSKKWRRNQPALEMLHVCFNLTVAYVIFLSGIGSVGNRSACIAVTSLLQYSYLVTWCWIGVYTRDMYISLVKVYSKKASHYMAKVTALAYGIPFLFVVVHASVATAHFDNMEGNTIKTTEGVIYKTSTYFAENACWLHGYSLYFGFLVPVAAVLVHNMVSFGFIIYEVAWKSDSIDSSAKKKTALSKIRLASVIGTLVGMTWIFGFLLLISEDPVYAQVMSWLFALSNSTQGLSMFFILCVRSKDIRQTWWTPIQKKLCPSAFRSWAARKREFRGTVTSFYSGSTRRYQPTSKSTYASSSFHEPLGKEAEGDPLTKQRTAKRQNDGEFDNMATIQESPVENEERENEAVKVTPTEHETDEARI